MSMARAGGWVFLPPDLVVAKSHSGNFSQGQVGATYTIVVTNLFLALPGIRSPTSSAVTVVDTLPASLTATSIAGAGWSCTLATLTCTRSDPLDNGASFPPIILTVDVSATAPAIVANSVTVAGGGEPPYYAGNNTSDDSTVIDAIGVSPDLAIAKTHVGPFVQGQAGATYNMVVTNVGSGATSGTVMVTDTLPAGLTATAMSGSGWSCTLATVTCTRSDALAAGASYPAIVLAVNVSTTAPSSVINIAAVSGGGDTTPANGTTSDATAITAAAVQVAIPTLGEWAMLLLATFLALAGAAATRKR